MRAYGAKRYRDNIDAAKAQRRRHYQDNKQPYLDNAKRQRAEGYNWRDKNKKRHNYHLAARKAAKMQRTPVWADMDAIAAVYAACPNGMAIDHVIPLRGKTVSGLHIASNLQYLTKAANSAKGNKYDPNTYPEQRQC